MGPQKRRTVLEPVLENYMGPPISYNTPAGKPPRHGAGTAKVAPTSEPAKHHHDSPKSVAAWWNPLHLIGKLRDRYIKAMNEVSMGGDLASVAGYHGCVADTECLGSVEQHRRSSAREKEIRTLREELAARRRKSEGLGEESDDEDLGVAERHHRQYKPSHMR